MFHITKIKLTAWYLIIIMLISILFSMVIYSVVNLELTRFERIQIRIQEDSIRGIKPPLNQGPRFGRISNQELAEIRLRLIISLISINLIVFVLAGTAGYFLAGRTLRPIKEMIDEQDRFISDASHELRTPITSLKSEIEVNLRDRSLTALSLKKVLKSNLEEVNKLHILSDNLIKLAQNKNNNYLKLESTSLLKVINEAVSKLEKAAKNKNIKVVNNIKDVKVKGDYQSLVEVMVILLDNAIKYSPANKNIILSVERLKDQIIVKVEDNGIGISEEDRPHIFDRFYRAEKARNKNGYGLGLSIAQKIVKNHGGEIKVENKKNNGTIFSFMLNLV